MHIHVISPDAEAKVNIEEQTLGHYYWPDIDIDVDLTDEIIEHPERFPLKAKNITSRSSEDAAGRGTP